MFALCSNLGFPEGVYCMFSIINNVVILLLHKYVDGVLYSSHIFKCVDGVLCIQAN